MPPIARASILISSLVVVVCAKPKAVAPGANVNATITLPRDGFAQVEITLETERTPMTPGVYWLRAIATGGGAAVGAARLEVR